jgi:hypothetical protein
MIPLFEKNENNRQKISPTFVLPTKKYPAPGIG